MPTPRSMTPTEVVLKPHIAVEIKARGGKKAEHTREYVTILNRSAMQPWARILLFDNRLRLYSLQSNIQPEFSVYK